MLQFIPQSRNKFCLRNLADDLPFFDQQTFPDAACNTQVRFLCFAGSVYDTAHDCDLDIQVRELRCKRFYLIREADLVDLRASAGRTADNLNTAFAQSQRPQNQLRRFDLFYNIPCQGYTDRIADSLI